MQLNLRTHHRATEGPCHGPTGIILNRAGDKGGKIEKRLPRVQVQPALGHVLSYLRICFVEGCHWCPGKTGPCGSKVPHRCGRHYPTASEQANKGTTQSWWQQAAGKSSWLSKSAGRMYEPASAVAVPCHCGDVGVVHDIPTPNMRPPQHAAHHNNAAQRLSNLQFTTTLTGALSNNTTAGHAFRSDGTPLR